MKLLYDFFFASVSLTIFMFHSSVCNKIKNFIVFTRLENCFTAHKPYCIGDNASYCKFEEEWKKMYIKINSKCSVEFGKREKKLEN